MHGIGRICPWDICPWDIYPRDTCPRDMHYSPLVFRFEGFLRWKTRLFESNSAVSSMRARERTFSISLGDKSSIRVMPNSSRDKVKFCDGKEYRNKMKKILH